MEPGPSDTKPALPEQPLLQLLIRLTSCNKSATLLKNSEIVTILKEEFKVNTNLMNYVELEIYVSLMKRFLKDWPRWDELELIVSDFRKKNQQESLDTTLKREYEKLKSYLSDILKQSDAIIKEVVKPENLNQDPGDINRVVLEICCTRDQLNTLVFQTPQGSINNIFNGMDATPSKIMYVKPSLRSILNWFDVEVLVNTHFFSYTRSNVHVLSQNIVNRKVFGKTVQKIVLDDNIKENSTSKVTAGTDSVLELLGKLKEKLLSVYKTKSSLDTIELVLDLLIQEIQGLNVKTVCVPGKYKFSLSKYGYVRYLCRETAEENSEYDIQLEETVSPTNIITITRFTEIASIPKLPNDWLQIKCVLCNVKFSIDTIDNLVSHFMEKHSNEPDWMCTNCLKILSMTNLTDKDWYHKCLN